MNTRTKITAVTISLLLTAGLGYVSLFYFGEYGWTVFFTVPFLIGLLPPLLLSRSQELSWKEAMKWSFITLSLFCLGLLIFAVEGVICIAMASPMLILLTGLGSFIACFIQKRKWASTRVSIIGLLFIALGSMSFDSVYQAPNLIPVSSKVVINASIEEVWSQVVTFDKMEEPQDWLFKTGISYPTHATIKGSGVGAIRYCNFSTGSFVEPITKWEEPNLLQFTVTEQPIPMNEFNPFWDIQPPHLDGYFQSQKGEFRLSKISANETLLIGTTWYKVDLSPEFYWQLWSDFIIHRIHDRVLGHIKKEAEEG
ncbi:hypothetical protein N8482_01535 [Chitinophagales bacterium]|nr:hypothetical protein [Chitinophagales bacterium]